LAGAFLAGAFLAGAFLAGAAAAAFFGAAFFVATSHPPITKVSASSVSRLPFAKSRRVRLALSMIAALLSTRSEVFVRRNIPNATGTKHTRHPTPCLLALFVRIKFFNATCFRQVFHKIFEIFFRDRSRSAAQRARRHRRARRATAHDVKENRCKTVRDSNSNVARWLQKQFEPAIRAQAKIPCFYGLSSMSARFARRATDGNRRGPSTLAALGNSRTPAART
jgi:hypothetical protein